MNANKNHRNAQPSNRQTSGGKQKKTSLPSNAAQWAADAYQALEKALIAFEQEYPAPDEDERLELIGYAAELAADARGITDPNRIDQADEYAVDNVLADLDASERDQQEEVEKPQYSILFLLCYLDAHVAYGLLSENQLETIMTYLVENYELIVD